jgi:hypothetical protein
MTEQPTVAPAPPPLPTFDTPFNLGSRRAKRNERRPQPRFVLDDGVEITAPKGLPIPVFAPLLDVNLDLPLLIRAVTTAQQEGGAEAAGQMLIDFFIGNPDLPRQVIAAVQQVLRNLFGDDGYAALVAWQPEPEDMRDLATALLRHYGTSLGELSGSSASSKSTGEPPTPISAASTDLTSEGPSTETPEAPDGSPSAA